MAAEMVQLSFLQKLKIKKIDEGNSILDEIISKTTPGLEIPDRNRGMEDNEDFIDRGNPTNDSRIVSEEMGLVGFKDIPDRNRGMEVNENFIDRGDPMNDIRVVSEEQGLVGGIPDRNRGQIRFNTNRWYYNNR